MPLPIITDHAPRSPKSASAVVDGAEDPPHPAHHSRVASCVVQYCIFTLVAIRDVDPEVNTGNLLAAQEVVIA